MALLDTKIMRGTRGGGGRHLPSQVRGRSMRDDKREKQTSSRIIKYAIGAIECVKSIYINKSQRIIIVYKVKDV